MGKIFKILTSAAAAFISVAFIGISAAASSAGIDDKAGLYTADEIAVLEARQQEVADHTGWNIAVVTTNTGFGEDGYNAIEYAEDYYDRTFGKSSSGILYLIDIDYRHFCISGEADHQYFNNSRVNKMVTECEEYYFDYDDVGNLNAFYDNVIKVYDSGPFKIGSSYDPYNSSYISRINFSFGAALIFGLIAAVIGVAAVYSRYKFHYQPTANNYLEKDKIGFYRRNDMFIREFTTKARVSDDSGGHGGGGGGGHGSSGGHSHGGGGHGGRR